MNVDGKQLRAIWLDKDSGFVQIIDQRLLPHEFIVTDLRKVSDVVKAIKDMYVRGAPLIGVTGAYGVYLAALETIDKKKPAAYLKEACEKIKAARPTAINLAWAVDRVLSKLTKTYDLVEIKNNALIEAEKIANEEVENCRKIGEHGITLIEKTSVKKCDTVNILTHCNAGWLACVDYGTATAPIYAAFDKGIDVHVWVDETRPLNQGARLTAWELGKHGVKHTVITDNAGGHLMQNGMVDMVIVGTDRSTYTGDVANKIGTYLKALAAKDNGIPFYVALPSSTFDWECACGVTGIPIEERDPDEVRKVQGVDCGTTRNVIVPPLESPAANYAFDVTPSRLVTAFITERGICKANESDIKKMFPEKISAQKNK